MGRAGPTHVEPSPQVVILCDGVREDVSCCLLSWCGGAALPHLVPPDSLPVFLTTWHTSSSHIPLYTSPAGRGLVVLEGGAGKSFVLAGVGRGGLLCLAAISSFPDKVPIPCPMLRV